jgi:hypothetical protein
MSFDTLDEVKEFYKTYAHESGFSVRIGAQSKKSDVVNNKRFMCSRKVSQKDVLNQTSKRSTQR